MSDIRDKLLFSKEEPTVINPSKVYIHHLFDLVRTELRETGDRDWLVDCISQASIKISHIEGLACKVASGLKRLGFNNGDTLHTAYNSCLDFYWPVLGAWLAGGLVSVGDPALSTDLFKSQILDTKAKIVVCTANAAPRIVEANQKIPKEKRVDHILVIDREPWQEIPSGCKSFRSLFNDDGSQCPAATSLPFEPEQPVVIHWSSGTTGRPKGILHSQRYLYRMLKKSKLPPKTISLSSNIMFHAGAFLLPFDGGINNRFTCCFIKEEEFSGPVLVDTIEKYRPSFYMCGTNHFTSLSNEPPRSQQDLTSLFCVMPAGGAINASAVEKMKKLLPGLSMIYQFYGCTEIGGISMSLDHTCLGSLMPGVCAYIRDRETDEKLGPNKNGEIMVKTKGMMLGYLNREEETKGFLDKDGFAHMGDLGHYDQSGLLYFHSRIKELLKVSNYWFGPGEVENVLEQIPGIEEAVVWGMYDPASGDDKVHAGLVISSNPDNLEVLTKDDIVRHVANNLQSQKHLTGEIHFLDSIPHNPQGKKLRQQIKLKFAK